MSKQHGIEPPVLLFSMMLLDFGMVIIEIIILIRFFGLNDSDFGSFSILTIVLLAANYYILRRILKALRFHRTKRINMDTNS